MLVNGIEKNNNYKTFPSSQSPPHKAIELPDGIPFRKDFICNIIIQK